ncbi:MAG: MBL fold metallo-hydrolase [Acidobacteria bacterium]|nr:MBL fold metallo-hydrolase [Acidobacteriota bacterium]
MQSLRWLSLAFVLAVPNLAAADQLFDVQPVVPSVWAAIARPQYKVNCNASIIELDDGLLVVDTHSKPSAARALIEQIKTISNKPVRFVVDTRFHWDHYQGNAAYLSAWPAGVEIISSEARREGIEHRGIPRVKNQLMEVPKEIEKLKSDFDKAAGPEQRAQISENLRQDEAYLAELKTMQVTLPTITFDRSLIIHRPSRNVHILWLGKAHTDGDIWVYLPKEKFVASGDALQGSVPYMGDGSPYDWIKTLEAAEQLNFDYTVGGHGGVMRGKAQFQLWRTYLIDLMAPPRRTPTPGGKA